MFLYVNKVDSYTFVECGNYTMAERALAIAGEVSIILFSYSGTALP